MQCLVYHNISISINRKRNLSISIKIEEATDDNDIVIRNKELRCLLTMVELIV